MEALADIGRGAVVVPGAQAGRSGRHLSRRPAAPRQGHDQGDRHRRSTRCSNTTGVPTGWSGMPTEDRPAARPARRVHPAARGRRQDTGTLRHHHRAVGAAARSSWSTGRARKCSTPRPRACDDGVMSAQRSDRLSSRPVPQRGQSPDRLVEGVVALAEGEAHQVIPLVGVSAAGSQNADIGIAATPTLSGNCRTERRAVVVSERTRVGAEEVGAEAVVHLESDARSARAPAGRAWPATSPAVRRPTRPRC